jgi:hypothetical protein
MKKANTVAFALFVLLSVSMFFGGSAYAGPTFVKVLATSQPSAENCDLTRTEPDDFSLGGKVVTGYIYAYKCDASHWAYIKSAGVETDSGYLTCDLTISSWKTGFFSQTWHHKVETTHADQGCQVSSVNNNNRFDAVFGLVPKK